MITYTLIITYILLGTPNELVIEGFVDKTSCQIQAVSSSSALRKQDAKVETAICHRVILDSRR